MASSGDPGSGILRSDGSGEDRGSGDTSCQPVHGLPLFPGMSTFPPELLGDDPSALIVQALPTLGTVLLWALIEKVCRREASMGARHLAGGVVLATSAAQALLVWQMFSLLGCDASFSVEMWRLVGFIGVPVLNVLLFFGLSRYTPRLVVAAFFALAGGVLFSDWALRGGIIASPAAHPLAAMQQCFDILAVCSIYLIRGPTAPRRPPWRRRKATRPLPTPDPLAAAPHEACRNEPGHRTVSWFSV